MITLLHTGQTGVERGADRAARAVGIPCSGYCQATTRDELAPLPAHIAADLTPVERLGARRAWEPTLAKADFLVIVVPDIRTASSITGITALRREARGAGVAQVLIDPTTNLDEVAQEIRRREAEKGDLAVMVTGPRKTRWEDGERQGWNLVTRISLTDGVDTHRVLVVDPAAKKELPTLVSLLGHKCVAAVSAEEAIAVASRLRPSIALLNVDVSSADELARALREISAPVYIASLAHRDANPPAGVDDHLVLPVDAELLHRVFTTARERLKDARSRGDNR